jgi:predicted ribosomally synthesized peptide with nif11-like leader
MSIDQAKAAINRMKTDSAFKNRIMEISDVSKRIQFLNESGFHCTLEDINKLTKLDQDAASLACDKMVYSYDPNNPKRD